MFVDAENNPSETLHDIFKLENLRVKYPNNVIFSYLNVNSVRNKLSGLTNLIFEYADIVIVAETKLDTSFPTVQFLMPGFHKLFRLEFT